MDFDWHDQNWKINNESRCADHQKAINVWAVSQSQKVHTHKLIIVCNYYLMCMYEGKLIRSVFHAKTDLKNIKVLGIVARILNYSTV